MIPGALLHHLGWAVLLITFCSELFLKWILARVKTDTPEDFCVPRHQGRGLASPQDSKCAPLSKACRRLLKSLRTFPCSWESVTIGKVLLRLSGLHVHTASCSEPLFAMVYCAAFCLRLSFRPQPGVFPSSQLFCRSLHLAYCHLTFQISSHPVLVIFLIAVT